MSILTRTENISKLFASFFIFGLVNNVLYVIILTAAHDLVPPTTPKSLILLADILPAFTLKLSLPLLAKTTHIHPGEDGPTGQTETQEPGGSAKEKAGLGINYPRRLAVIVILSCIGMFLTSLPTRLPIVLFGIVLASLSSGLGEITFLQLSHYYNSDNSNIPIHGWSSGTGGAGLVGSGLILLLTTIFKFPITWVLRASALIPLVQFWVYHFFLPTPLSLTGFSSASPNEENIQLLEESSIAFENLDLIVNRDTGNAPTVGLSSLIQKVNKYIFVYMFPLAMVYFAEYTINQGVAPTMLFPLNETPFSTYRDSYVTYGTIYQIGVFVSRSSGSFFKIKYLNLMGLLQTINLVACILQSIYIWIPSIWIVFILIFYEGLLGGAAYVNTFMNVSEEVPFDEREFALGCVGMSDSFGIVLAASISMWLEPELCRYQQGTGRNWCTQK